jgi:hypothetical protein
MEDKQVVTAEDENSEEVVETNQDETEFTGTSEEETDTAEPLADKESEETNENAEEESVSENEEESKPSANRGIPDAKAAQKRIEREAKEKALREKIARENYQKGLIDAVGGKNPYTGKDMKDSLDVEEFLIMRDIEKNGGDPITDYAEAQKERKRQAQEESNAETAKAEQIQDELRRFKLNYPDVDVSEVLSDKRFAKFAGKRIEKGEGLNDVYADFISFTADIDSEAKQKAEVKAFNANAKRKASPGSLAGNVGEPKTKSYADMSDDELEKAIAKAKRGELH